MQNLSCYLILEVMIIPDRRELSDLGNVLALLFVG